MIPFALPQMFSCLLPYFIYACSLMVFLQKSSPWLCYASHFALIYTLSPHFILAENNIYLKVTSWYTFIYYLLSLLDTQLLGTRISHNLLTWNLWTVCVNTKKICTQWTIFLTLERRLSLSFQSNAARSATFL